ncbi:hypothetical protein EPN28_03555 [Patescibacteria group bacterium]|nr:MAG: hypothetical protein EPN28_03555 [Patescibacteria group bacterium]
METKTQKGNLAVPVIAPDTDQLQKAIFTHEPTPIVYKNEKGELVRCWAAFNAVHAETADKSVFVLRGKIVAGDANFLRAHENAVRRNYEASLIYKLGQDYAQLEMWDKSGKDEIPPGTFSSDDHRAR